MELAVHPNELILIYSHHSQVSKKTLAYAKSVSDHIRLIDVEKEKLPNTIWEELLNLLNLNAKDLLDRSHPEYQKKIRGHEYTDEDWLKVLSHNPKLLKAPIAVKNKKAVLCLRAKDVLNL